MKKPKEAWQQIVARYHRSDNRRAVRQVINTFGPYLALWGVMIWTINISYWITLPLAILSAGFLMRGFIILHDCGHGSFFTSRKANDILGFISGILTFTPYAYWRHRHAMHHATAGNLDKRGAGDVWTMTTEEYRTSSWRKRLGFRLFRHPLVLLVLGPAYMFLIQHRFAAKGSGWRWHLSVAWTNLCLIGVGFAVSSLIGFWAYVGIQLPIILVTGAAGVWMFYVQHNFEGAYWERSKNWSYVESALKGSSYYELPRVLQWFSGNIGFHHIHHLSPRIPNYFLEKAHKENALFRSVRPMRIKDSLKSLHLRLWDEEKRMLVGFRQMSGEQT